MLVDTSTSAAGSAVTGAIRQASTVTGTSFNYLLATAQVESGLNPQAGASTSSARGLFQFVDQTWLGTMKESGAALGYARCAAAITRTPSGHYDVKDPALRSEILKLRNDPIANAVMAGAFTQANAAILTDKLGRAPSEGELYVAHFLGAGGAARLISLAASNPNAKADEFFPFAARANTSIFYDRTTGRPRSLAQVRDTLTARYDVARSSWGEPMPSAQAVGSLSGPLVLTPAIPAVAASSANAAIAASDTAGITGAYAAAADPKPVAISDAKSSTSDGQGFRALFQDTDRPAPPAGTVSALWDAPKPVPGTSATAASTVAAASMLDLFKDPEERS